MSYKKIVTEKTYTILLVLYEDGSNMMKRTNDGFEPLELMGIVDFIKLEIREQILGNLKVDVIKREKIIP
jgi:hypothetical protein